MRKEYSTLTLVLLAIIAGPVIQPLAWFYLVPLYSPHVSNFSVYWVSYFFWAAFSLVMSVKASGESKKQPKGAPYIFAFIVCFFAIGVLAGTYPVLVNVVYSWFGGFMLGFCLGAVIYLLKPSLNVIQNDKREESRRSRLVRLDRDSPGRKY